jgi:hypothetical protein
MVLVASATASSSSTIVFTNLSSSYRAYMLEYDSVYPSADFENLLMTVSTDNGSTYLTTNYQRALTRVLSTSNTVSGNSSTGDSVFYIGSLDGYSNTSTNTGNGIVYLFAPNTAQRLILTQHTMTRNANVVGEFVSGGMLQTTTTAVNAFKLRFGSGTVAGGNFRLYALVNA